LAEIEAVELDQVEGAQHRSMVVMPENPKTSRL